MTETSIAHSPNGQTFSVDRTVYVQGNKQKVERKNITTVTDLDKSIVYTIDRNDRVYSETPLQALIPARPGNMQGATIQLNQTGETRIIADQACHEYRAVEGSSLEWVTTSLCVSTDAPGAKEISQFQHRMIRRLDGDRSGKRGGNEPASLVLEKKSILRFRVPGSSRGQAYRTVSLIVETRVDRIEMKPLPLDTFKPPAGYGKLHDQPQPVSPDSIEARWWPFSALG